MQRAPLALLAALAAPLALSLPAHAQSVRLSYGLPLGSFTATPAGQVAAPRVLKKVEPATHDATRRRKAQVAAAAAVKPAPNAPRPLRALAQPAPQAPLDVRDDAARTTAPLPVSASLELQNVEIKTEADAPRAVVSGEIGTCRKFIATAGTTVEVPCTAARE